MSRSTVQNQQSACVHGATDGIVVSVRQRARNSLLYSTTKAVHHSRNRTGNSASQFYANICDCILSHISAKCAYRIFFPHNSAFSTAILILLVFLLPISISFCYIGHLVSNRMAPSVCPDSCGTRRGSWFQAALYHISAAYLAFMRSAYF